MCCAVFCTVQIEHNKSVLDVPPGHNMYLIRFNSNVRWNEQQQINPNDMLHCCNCADQQHWECSHIRTHCTSSFQCCSFMKWAMFSVKTNTRSHTANEKQNRTGPNKVAFNRKAKCKSKHNRNPYISHRVCCDLCYRHCFKRTLPHLHTTFVFLRLPLFFCVYSCVCLFVGFVC